MTTTFVDVAWHSTEPGDPGAGWVRYSPPPSHPSPAGLAAAGELASRGEAVRYHHGARADALADASIGPGAHVHVIAPAPHRADAQALADELAARGATTELLDPWTPRARADAGYALVRGSTLGLAEIDVAPASDPVHPWASPAPSLPPLDGTGLAAAVASFAPADGRHHDRPTWQAHERDLYLDDPRVPLTMDRLRVLARLVKLALHEHGTMLKLHVRVWPGELDRQLADHLTLLPVGSISLLAGSVEGAGPPGAASASSVEQALANARDGGISHLTELSLVLALPGQAPQDCLDSIKRALSLAAAARVRRLRFAFWRGDDAPYPATAGEHDLQFATSHPDWDPIEYAGVVDFLGLMRHALRGMDLVGPGLVPGWEPATPA